MNDELSRAAVKTREYLKKAEILTLAQRSDEARSVLNLGLAEADQAANRSPTALNLFLRARVRLALGNSEGSRSDLEAALDRSPRFSAAAKLLAGLPPPAEAERISP